MSKLMAPNSHNLFVAVGRIVPARDNDPALAIQPAASSLLPSGTAGGAKFSFASQVLAFTVAADGSTFDKIANLSNVDDEVSPLMSARDGA